MIWPGFDSPGCCVQIYRSQLWSFRWLGSLWNFWFTFLFQFYMCAHLVWSSWPTPCLNNHFLIFHLTFPFVTVKRNCLNFLLPALLLYFRLSRVGVLFITLHDNCLPVPCLSRRSLHFNWDSVVFLESESRKQCWKETCSTRNNKLLFARSLCQLESRTMKPKTLQRWTITCLNAAHHLLWDDLNHMKTCADFSSSSASPWSIRAVIQAAVSAWDPLCWRLFGFIFPMNSVVQVMTRQRKYVCWQSHLISAQGSRLRENLTEDSSERALYFQTFLEYSWFLHSNNVGGGRSSGLFSSRAEIHLTWDSGAVKNEVGCKCHSAVTPADCCLRY